MFLQSLYYSSLCNSPGVFPQGRVMTWFLLLAHSLTPAEASVQHVFVQKSFLEFNVRVAGLHKVMNPATNLQTF